MGTLASQIHADDLGYEACLDRGVVALDSGITNVALGYLVRAVEFRPTRFALVQLAKAHRDLGQIAAARVRLEQARALPDGHSDGYVLVSLAAVLCDLRDYGPALEVALEAVKAEPQNPAALKIAERCLREPALALSRSPGIDPGAIAKVQSQADDLGHRAAELERGGPADLLERRRERATQGWLLARNEAPEQTSVAQEPAVVIGQDPKGSGAGVDVHSLPVDEPTGLVKQRPGVSWWQRIKSVLWR